MFQCLSYYIMIQERLVAGPDNVHEHVHEETSGRPRSQSECQYHSEQWSLIIKTGGQPKQTECQYHSEQ